MKKNALERVADALQAATLLSMELKAALDRAVQAMKELPKGGRK